MTTWFERRPGSEETLLALYDVVVAAEELDLGEQAEHERLLAVLASLDEEPAEETAEPAESVAEPDEDDRPSMSQVVGMVQHLLGARPLGPADTTA